ncbi:metallophosphoesterase family protein [Halodesulfovibrio sp.]|jgi:predicted phosphodiesterase|uniref:metallophosphoesterase family protein n=1 Tax=Halodesulfovibrio sp. TaxID=1912772 RepID=UPI0025D83E89|nr:metallophosphoesterase family protein [Halodesulfovibrio sp.]MCT4535614.1 metallophosphoesterase family protein [Halodesulfovibrio sp.]MCT4626600.1 metallophosphoesterase family protein [Halodesulfovibrio sp.]
MRIAVLSDIHANYEALTHVLHDITHSFPDVSEIISLGDIVGYGPDPELCVKAVQERGIISVAGNHELGVGRSKYRSCFNKQSIEVVDKTALMLSEQSLQYLRSLPLVLSLHGALFVHGLPPRSAFQYIWELDDERVLLKFSRFPEQIAFLGHTHELGLVRAANGVVERCDLHEGEYTLDFISRYMVNAGAVGQPRDGDPRAKYLVWDTESHELIVRCVAYDPAETVAKMKARGLPERYARRLMP